jgi:hypothetical protein
MRNRSSSKKPAAEVDICLLSPASCGIRYCRPCLPPLAGKKGRATSQKFAVHQLWGERLYQRARNCRNSYTLGCIR